MKANLRKSSDPKEIICFILTIAIELYWNGGRTCGTKSGRAVPPSVEPGTTCNGTCTGAGAGFGTPGVGAGAGFATGGTPGTGAAREGGNTDRDTAAARGLEGLAGNGRVVSTKSANF
jgi:hypothetical protein